MCLWTGQSLAALAMFMEARFSSIDLICSAPEVSYSFGSGTLSWAEFVVQFGGLVTCWRHDAS